MMCKADSVHYVKQIMPHQTIACTCCWLAISIPYATGAKTELAKSAGMYIITFTYRGRHSGDLVHVQQGGQKVQARRPQAAWHTQSTSGRSDRPSVRDWRFLRSRRRRASQVRDASPRHCRQAISHSVRYGIRLLTPYLLSSGSGLSARWPLRAIAREARAAARPQTHAERFGLRYATPVKQSCAAPSGLGHGHPGTVRYKCSSTEYRTRTKAAGKKTSLNPVGGVRKTAERETLISAYEDLRRQGARCSSSGGLGMAIFLDQGMVAWMLACSWAVSTTPDNVRRCPITTAPLPDELRGEIVLVLAAMALKQVTEVHS